jgi:hypothetical protein
MNNRELKIKLISEQLAGLEIQVRNLNAQNLCDLNSISENSICGILNLTFGYKLINLNPEKSNYAGIDLADSRNRISVQVTSDKSKKKIQKTLNTFSQNQLDKKYDRLIIFILGEKQKQYRNLNIPVNLDFDISDDIFDFKKVLKFISSLPIEKIEKINKFLEAELKPQKPKTKSKTSRTAFKQKYALNKRIEKALIRNFTEKEWFKYREAFTYEPSRKYKYGSLIVRSIDDKSFPDQTFNEQGMPSWTKLELWDFYDNGLEFVRMSNKQVVLEEDGTWDFCESSNQNAIGCSIFLRISYDNMVEYDNERDGYHGYPTLYVEYNNNGSPVEKQLYGLIGFYDFDKPQKSRMAYYFDEKKKKIKTE